MNVPWLAVLLASHLACALPFAKKIGRNETPSIVDFASLSFLLYYDLGIALETFGAGYESGFFSPWLGRTNPWLSPAFAILFFAPWALRFGAALGRFGPEQPLRPENSTSELRASRARLFYVLAVAASLACALWSLSMLLRNPLLWIARLELTSSLGPYYVLFYLPACLLAYFLCQRNISPWKRRVMVTFLLVCSMLSALPVGERTDVLLPLIMAGLFYKPLTSRRIAAMAVIGAVSASLLLPVFKVGEKDNSNIQDMVMTTIWADFSRSQVLMDVLRRSDAAGTKIMPYPGAGYVYSALLFVPRNIAPFKGRSTAVEYTAAVTGTPASETTWGFGIGVIEELALNFGAAAVFPGLVIYGLALEWTEKFARAVPSTGISLRLGAIWLCGYHLPALLQVFGTMVMVAAVLSRFFSCRESQQTAARLGLDVYGRRTSAAWRSGRASRRRLAEA